MNDDRSHTGNLNRLAAHLEGLPDNYTHFDMESFFHDPRFGGGTGLVVITEGEEIIASMNLLEPVEGMVACALGHTAAAGNILPDVESWAEVALTVYGVEGEAYDYLFGGDWYVRDNTPKGAAQRMHEYLRAGVPEGWRVEDEDFVEQRDLCLV